MYCRECKLLVADESLKVCPVCQGLLQSDPEQEAEAVSGAESQDKVMVESSDDSGLEFDPEALGLKSSDHKKPEDEVGDMRILADIWEKEDIDTDLDGVLAEAFSVETVDLIPEDTVAPEVKEFNSFSSESHFDDDGSRRNFWLPLLILVGLTVALAGGWVYMRHAGEKPAAGISDTSKKAELTETQVVAENEKLPLTERPIEESSSAPVPETVEPETVKTEPAVAAVEAGADLNPDKPAAAVEPERIEAPQDSPEKSLVEVNDTGTVAAPSAAEESASVEIPEKVQPASKSEVPETSALAPVAAPAVLAPGKGVSEADSVPEKTVSGTVAPATPSAPAAVNAKESRYVVHVGSFRNLEGVARQLAKLHKKGFAAYSVEADLGAKGVWQRIFIPGGDSLNDAKRVQARLAEQLPQEDSLIRKLKK